MYRQRAAITHEENGQRAARVGDRLHTTDGLKDPGLIWTSSQARAGCSRETQARGGTFYGLLELELQDTR